MGFFCSQAFQIISLFIGVVVLSCFSDISTRSSKARSYFIAVSDSVTLVKGWRRDHRGGRGRGRGEKEEEEGGGNQQKKPRHGNFSF
jgi:hypothetical protein